MTLLKVSSVTKRIEGDFCLENISFSQKKHQKIAVAGETGSGKSTLLKIIAGLVEPDSGDVFFQKDAVNGPVEKLIPGHPGIAYLSQNFELPKFLRVEQVLTYANKIQEAKANTLYEVCHISHLLKRKTDQLSGGERQRIAMARLLTSWPRLLLLDEPFSHLDMVHKNILKSVIKDIGEKLKITIILVSHDPADTLSWADEIIVMKDGKMIQQGTPEEVYRNPANEYVAGLFGKYNVISGRQSKVFFPKAKVNGKSESFLRPENFRIVSKSAKAVKGKVTRSIFLGGHYELEVTTGGKCITVRTDKTKAEVGDTVYLSAVK
jgi:iron(III) transport system ATP-binding protein